MQNLIQKSRHFVYKFCSKIGKFHAILWVKFTVYIYLYFNILQRGKNFLTRGVIDPFYFFCYEIFDIKHNTDNKKDVFTSKNRKLLSKISSKNQGEKHAILGAKFTHLYVSVFQHITEG